MSSYDCQCSLVFTNNLKHNELKMYTIRHTFYMYSVCLLQNETAFQLSHCLVSFTKNNAG